MKTIFKYLIATLGVLSVTGIFAIDKEWREDTDFGVGVGLTFPTETDYKLEIRGEGPFIDISGKYVATDSGIQITSIIAEGEPEDIRARYKLALEGNTCTLSTEVPSLKYYESLTCERGAEKVVFWNVNRAPIGEKEMVWQGVRIVTIGIRDGYTTDCVRLREKPSLKSKAIQFIPGWEMPPVGCIPKDTKIVVYARTPSKQKVQGRTNYWYLIEAGMNKYQWVFGEFVRVLK